MTVPVYGAAQGFAADVAEVCGATVVPLAAEPATLEAAAGAPLMPAPQTGGNLPPLMPILDACSFRIQPGARMTSPVGCTMNWIVQDETGAYYMGTAGHCLGRSGSDGKVVRIAGVGEIGVSVYNINAGVGRDFGLVKIHEHLYDQIEPALCYWGGPSGVADFEPQGGVATSVRKILHYGQGVVVGTHQLTRPRVHASHGATSSSFSIDGVIASGDSGSPVMLADGSAAGVVTHGIIGLPGLFVIGPGHAQRLDVGLAMASAYTGHTFTVVTSDGPTRLPAEVTDSL